MFEHLESYRELLIENSYKPIHKCGLENKKMVEPWGFVLYYESLQL